MKILIVTQYYYPENFKSNDLSFELQKRGHNVTVLTGLPNYPEGKIYEGYGPFQNRNQVINDVKIIRSLLVPRGKGDGVRLFINYFSFAFFASIRAFLLNFTQKFDAIIVHEPSPITQYYPAYLLNKLQKAPVYFWVMDLWPESLKTAGGIESNLILGIFRRMVINFYKNSKRILITSKGFEKSILEKGNFAHKIEYFPNWAEEEIADGDKTFPIPMLPEGFKIMFAGNLGESQDLENIMNAALLTNDFKHIKWIFVGDGRKMSYIKNFIETYNLQETVIILGKYPMEAMASFFDKADVMLVSLKNDPIFNLTVPAKIQAYMSASKPIVAMLNGEGAEIITEARAGVAVNAADYKSLAQEVIKLSQLSSGTLLAMGINARKFFVENFRLEKCIDKLEEILNAK